MTDRYWHFCAVAKDGTPVLRDDSLALGPGETETYQGTPALCRAGLHASKRAMDALSNIPRPWCRLVQLEGEVLHDKNKSVATRRLILASFDATAALHEFACCVAESALLLSETDDDRCWQAIEAKRAWLRGEIRNKGLAAASDAAYVAAWAPAYTARATSYAARDAAHAATYVAAYVAARGTAYSARDAAMNAAWVTRAAAYAARDAAWDEIGDLLESMLTEAADATRCDFGAT